MQINTEAGTSEDPRSIVLGIHDDPLRVDEITINYIETGESYDVWTHDLQLEWVALGGSNGGE